MGIFSIFKRKNGNKEQQNDIRNKENLNGLSTNSKRVIAGLINTNYYFLFTYIASNVKHIPSS